MFEFFGALIIGGFFLVKFVFGRIASGTSPGIEKKAKELEKKIRDIGFEWDLKRQLSPVDTRWMLLESIQNELREIYGDEWREFFYEDEDELRKKAHYFKDPLVKAFHILLAKNGLISRRAYFLNGPIWEEEYEEEKQRTIKTLRFMENHMHDNGIDIHILYIPHQNKEGEISSNFFEGYAKWDYNMKIGPLIGVRYPGIKRLWQ